MGENFIIRSNTKYRFLEFCFTVLAVANDGMDFFDKK